ncbi:MAG: nitroreductase [Beijerinckiaceae bacterium]|nr:nitroreductase [Beijerinckiaceae bacterium]
MRDDATTQNAALELMARRRSAPPLTMTGPAPDAHELETLLTLAVRTPDHGKLAPWRFIVFEGDARTRAGALFAEIFAVKHPGSSESQLEIERKRFSHAPLVVGVVSRAAPHPKIPEWEQVLSAGAVCMNLTHAASALGFASAWLTQWVAYDRDVLNALGVAADEKVAGFVHIGRRTGAVEDRPRPSLSDVVTRF